MKLTWLGHSGFRLEWGGATVLIDPWLVNNPAFDETRRAEAIEGATHVLLTHGHFDHAEDTVAIARELGIPVVGCFDLMNLWAEVEGIETTGFNKGGTVMLEGLAVTMVNASHSSSMPGMDTITYAGAEVGYMIAHEGRTVYVSGDTDIMADMAWMGELHAPQVGILSCGGHFTMDMGRAAWAAKKYFAFETVVPCHYGTFPLLEQSADRLKADLPGVDVVTPQVMETVEI